MIQIRNSIFETNSSSVHAICIDTDSSIYAPDFVDIESREFGWEYEHYYSVEDKLTYLFTAIMTCGWKDDADNRLDKLREFLRKNNIGSSIEDAMNKVKVDHYKGMSYYSMSGYIDHSDSLNEFLDEVLNDDNLLYHYLFGDSVIITGNDNSEYERPECSLFENYDWSRTDNKFDPSYEHYDKIFWKDN